MDRGKAALNLGSHRPGAAMVLLPLGSRLPLSLMAVQWTLDGRLNALQEPLVNPEPASTGFQFLGCPPVGIPRGEAEPRKTPPFCDGEGSKRGLFAGKLEVEEHPRLITR